MEQEMNLHVIVDWSQSAIMKLLKKASPECHITFPKDRVDETNILRVVEMAEKYLSPEKAGIVVGAKQFLKEAVDQLCIDYHGYALSIGRLYGGRYRVPTIDTDSLASEALSKAAFRFAPLPNSDPARIGTSFKSYLSSWVRQNIQRSIPRVSVTDRDGKKSAVAREVYSLNSAIRDGESASRIDQITSEDTVWGDSEADMGPAAIEELRQSYCPHLSTEEMMELIGDPDQVDSMLAMLE